ncbi:hypothetical protein EZV62_020924 [Acer yangbiense]|uniref:Disease resistance protein At4g27190-like leucine-rich repeats domain-containing protein n=1 Tax=Acer yangbiense TaxID=1000413 RepID=A0A5C7HG02_9ROSI|nr:hypothetical protein EZV62_020924 [Acer yangbiense]
MKIDHTATSPRLGNLVFIKISSCCKLKNLFTPSIVKGLVQLRTLEVKFCSTLEEIISYEKAETGGSTDRVTFPGLYQIDLGKLDSLTCFCARRCTIEFPALELLDIQKYPKMETFGCGDQVTPKLVNMIHLDGEERCMDNLNITLQQFFKEKQVSYSFFLFFSICNAAITRTQEIYLKKLLRWSKTKRECHGRLALLVNQFSNIDNADWVLFNTFYKLEEKVCMCTYFLYGPTVPSMYLDRRLGDDKEYGISLFKPETSACMSWLNGKPSGSVVYVSFGSLAELNQDQMGELAWGLKGSNYNFLWVVRESEESKLPNKFVEETSDQGLFVSWCPQLEVLAHESIGCFVTHCGFNSVLEALSLGVAMVAMPQWTDQPTNAKYVEDVWETGIRALPDEKGGVMRGQVVEKCIKEVMEGEKGKEMKKNAKKWKNLAREAIDEGGSSNKDTDEFVVKLLCSSY